MADQQKYELKTDPHGLVGRECPNTSCGAYFKIEAAEVESPELTCPACGRTEDCKKYTTVPQIEYINSLIFHRDSCPIEYNTYSKTPPCRDYVEVPAQRLYRCDLCGKIFGIDCKKPDFCPYCSANREHLHEDKL